MTGLRCEVRVGIHGRDVMPMKTYKSPQRQLRPSCQTEMLGRVDILVSGGPKCACQRGTDCLPRVYSAWRITRGMNMRLFHPGEDRCSTISARLRRRGCPSFLLRTQRDDDLLPSRFMQVAVGFCTSVKQDDRSFQPAQLARKSNHS
jgi:hypothetical protein